MNSTRDILPALYEVHYFGEVARPEQAESLERWARRHALNREARAAAYHVDKVNALVPRRDAWKRILKATAAADVDTVVVWHLHRLGRSFASMLARVQQLEDRGGRLISLGENLDSKSHQGRELLDELRAHLARYEGLKVAQWEWRERLDMESPYISGC